MTFRIEFFSEERQWEYIPYIHKTDTTDYWFIAVEYRTILNTKRNQGNLNFL